MTYRRLAALVALGLVSLLLVGVITASAASNTVPTSRVGQHLAAVTANDLKMPICGGLTLTARAAGTGAFTGTAASELLVGSATADTIDGAGGNDCIVAGSGNDHLIGGPGTDVCVGGYGTNTYDATCETVSEFGCLSPGSQTVLADRDSTIRQDTPSVNVGGTATIVEVLSEDGNRNMRVLVGFQLPVLPSKCIPTSVTLRLYNAAPTANRTIEARRVLGAWSETAVTWAGQPGVVEPAATSPAPLFAGWQTWTVTDQVRSMYTSGNHGFMLREQAESLNITPRQQYHSRENTNRPQLIVQW